MSGTSARGDEDTGTRWVVHPDPCGVRVEAAAVHRAGDGPDPSAGLASLLREHDCVIVDLSRAGAVDPSAVTWWISVLSRAVDDGGGWPEAKLVVGCPDASLREALTGAVALRGALVAESVEQARRRCGQRPARLSATWAFLGEPLVLARCREVVEERARSWARGAALVGRVEDVVLVANELVTNALEHARSTAVLRMTLDANALELAVQDRSAEPPRVRPHDRTARRGRGLQMVAALFDEWGWSPHDDGKTVWARLLLGRGATAD